MKRGNGNGKRPANGKKRPTKGEARLQSNPTTWKRSLPTHYGNFSTLTAIIYHYSPVNKHKSLSSIPCSQSISQLKVGFYFIWNHEWFKWSCDSLTQEPCSGYFGTMTVVILLVSFIVDPAPVPLEIFTEAQVQEALDQLRGVPAYNEVLVLQRLPPKDPSEVLAAQQRESAGQEVLTDALSEVRLVEGSVPPSF